jgi:hypothetical protein
MILPRLTRTKGSGGLVGGAELSEAVLALRYFHHRDDFPVWGFAVIDDLRPRGEKSR